MYFLPVILFEYFINVILQKNNKNNIENNLIKK